MSDPAGNATSEKKFQNEIVAAMLSNGWLLGESSKCNRESALYPEDLLGRINREVGEGSKSEKLAAALTGAQPIIIVTIQTFPHVLTAIESDVTLKDRAYAVIADEAHSWTFDVSETDQWGRINGALA